MTGAICIVYFSTSSDPFQNIFSKKDTTLNINSTGAKSIIDGGSSSSASSTITALGLGNALLFYYIGSIYYACPILTYADYSDSD